MERFESNNKTEQWGVRGIEMEIERNESLMENVREKFPSLEKIYKTGKTTLRMLVAIVMLGVGQDLFAQEDPKQVGDQFWNFQNLEKLKTENLSSVYNKIPSPVASIPEGRKTFGSYVLSGNSKEEPQRVISGEIPNQEGILGDLIVHTDSKTVTKEEMGDQNSIADTASFFVEVGRAEKEDVEGKEIIKRTITEEGETREQAIFNAIGTIGKTGTISIKNMGSMEKKEDDKDLSDNLVSISSISGLNYIQGVKIVSEKQLSSGFYEVTIEGNVVHNAE